MKKFTPSQNKTIKGYRKCEMYNVENVKMGRDGKARVRVTMADPTVLPNIESMVLVVGRRGKVTTVFRYTNGKVIVAA